MMAENKQDIVEKAKSALRGNAYGGFEDQAPHLNCLLENLPILGIDAQVVQIALCGGGEQMSLSSVLECLRDKWVCQHPPASHDGAIHVEVGEEKKQLVITFHLFLWGRSNEVRRFEIVRIGGEEFVYWDRGQLTPREVAELGKRKGVSPEGRKGRLKSRLVKWLRGLRGTQ
jgi:hypothetical protein